MVCKSIQAGWEIFTDHSPDPKQAVLCHGSNPARAFVARLVSAAWSKARLSGAAAADGPQW